MFPCCERQNVVPPASPSVVTRGFHCIISLVSTRLHVHVLTLSLHHLFSSSYMSSFVSVQACRLVRTIALGHRNPVRLLSTTPGSVYRPIVARHTFHNMAAAKAELDPNQGGDSTKKTYNKQATGLAWETVQAHSADNDLKLYGSCFCPFVHRVWISIEHKRLDYQYVEVDVYRKPKLLLDINPRGLVPALRHGDWGSYESTVLMEYLEDLNQGKPLLPALHQC